MRKFIFFLIIFFGLNNWIMAAEQTFHFRGDQHTISGQLGYKLGTSQGDTIIHVALGPLLLGIATYSCNSDVYIRHVDGSETLLGSSIASTSLTTDPGGYLDGTWNCPETDLVTTDAIKIVERTILEGGTATETWITDQLGWTKLNATTWTFHRMTFLGVGYIPQPPHWLFFAATTHGTIAGDTQVQNIGYISYSDIGIRLKAGNGTIKIGTLADLTGHSLRIRKGDTTYAIPLVETENPIASGIRIYDGSAIKALPKID